MNLSPQEQERIETKALEIYPVNVITHMEITGSFDRNQMFRELWIEGATAERLKAKEELAEKDKRIAELENGWISVDDRLPEILDDGESIKVLCVGSKFDRIETEQYEVMSYMILQPQYHRRASDGSWVTYGWSRDWWNTNPDHFHITHWKEITRRGGR